MTRPTLHSDRTVDPRRRSILRAATVVPFAVSGCAGDGPAASAAPAPTTTGAPAPTGSALPAAIQPVAGSSIPGAGANTSLTANVIKAGPTNYLSALRSLKPGDTLLLDPGTYDNPADVPGLPIFNLNGSPTQPIVISGPDSGPRPLFVGRSTHNTVRLSNASYVVLRNFDIDGRDLGGFGVATQGSAHHITIENLRIVGVGGNQQVVGISTTGWPTWNWTIRRNVIVGAGTGMYLGNSDGTSPFVAGLIEFNVIRDTIGYNLQIKHQQPRPAVAGMPTGRSTTVLRHNVFSKGANSSTGSMARPSVLIGHLPLSGPGTDDLYSVYGNFFWQNPSEGLFQGEGNVDLHANVFVTDTGNAIAIQPHNDVPKTIRVFANTVLARGAGIAVRGGDPAFTQVVAANAVFAGTPISGGDQSANLVDGYAAAGNYLMAVGTNLETFDAYPRAGAMRRPAFDAGAFASYPEHDRDFDGKTRDWTVRGAYGGDASAAAWRAGFAPKG
jgi:hypothetical protein